MSQAIALQPRPPRSLANGSSSASRALRSRRPMPAQYEDDFGAPAATLVTVADLLGYLGKRWKLGLLVALPLAAATFAFLGLGKKVYEAEARLLLRIQDANYFNFDSLSHSSVSEVSAPMLVNNHRAELKSRSYLNYLFDHIDAADRSALLAEYEPKPGWMDGIKKALGMTAPKRALEPQELFAVNLSLNTRVEPLKDSHILRVQVRDENAERAARVANHYVSDYIDYMTNLDVSVNKSAAEYLEKRGGELRSQLKESEKDLSDYKKDKGLVTDADARDIASEKVRLLTQALADAEVKHSKAKHDMDSVRLAQKNGTDLLSVKLIGDVPDVLATRKLLEAAQADLANMLVLMGRKHPRVMQMNEKIDTLRSQLKSNIDSTVAMVQQDENNSQLQVDDIKKQLEAARKEVLADGGKAIQQNLLKDQVAMDRELYRSIVLRMSQANLTGEFKENGTLRVSDIAVAPEKPVKPNKPIAALAALVIFMGCFIGLPVGMGFAEQHLVPALRGEPNVIPPPTDGKVSLVPQDMILARLPHVTPEATSNLLGALLRPGSPSAAALHDLTRQLEERDPDRKGPGIILVTSADSGEGKTSLSAALAATFCSLGRRVFMIESNSSSPSFHLLFPRSYTHASWNSDLELLRYGGSNLYVLPSQNLQANELTDLLESYRGWIEKASSQVDWIILDGAAVMRHLADITPLLPLAHDVLVVHDPARGSAENVNAALNLLTPRLPENTLCGVVMNREEA